MSSPMNHKGKWRKLETSLFSSSDEIQWEVASDRELVLATLNIGHGRGDKAHQLFLRQAEINRNLLEISSTLQQESPHIVALQEVDKVAFWSAMQDQSEMIACALGMPYALHGEHMCRKRLCYGTALLSRLPVDNGYSYAFADSGLLPPKGFVYGRVHLPGKSAGTINVISLHLDFARKKIRQQQVHDLAIYLERLDGPIVVMGDFNSEWRDNVSAVEFLASRLQLSSYLPLSKEFATFPRRAKRWDWILTSNDFEILEYTTHLKVLSDHRLVVSRVRLRE